MRLFLRSFNFWRTLFILIRFTSSDNKSILKTISSQPWAVKDILSVRLFLLYSLFVTRLLLLNTTYWMHRFFSKNEIMWEVLKHLWCRSVAYIHFFSFQIKKLLQEPQFLASVWFPAHQIKYGYNFPLWLIRFLNKTFHAYQWIRIYRT